MDQFKKENERDQRTADRMHSDGDPLHRKNAGLMEELKGKYLEKGQRSEKGGSKVAGDKVGQCVRENESRSVFRSYLGTTA